MWNNALQPRLWTGLLLAVLPLSYCLAGEPVEQSLDTVCRTTPTAQAPTWQWPPAQLPGSVQMDLLHLQLIDAPYLLANATAVSFSQQADGLHLHLPAQPAGVPVYAYRIELLGTDKSLVVGASREAR
jgi:hypothetical protein